MKKKQDGIVWIDDNRSVANMDNVGKKRRKRPENSGITLSKEERRAIKKAGLIAGARTILLVLLLFSVLFLLAFLWLR